MIFVFYVTYLFFVQYFVWMVTCFWYVFVSFCLLFRVVSLAIIELFFLIHCQTNKCHSIWYSYMYVWKQHLQWFQMVRCNLFLVLTTICINLTQFGKRGDENVTNVQNIISKYNFNPFDLYIFSETIDIHLSRCQIKKNAFQRSMLKPERDKCRLKLKYAIR